MLSVARRGGSRKTNVVAKAAETSVGKNPKPDKVKQRRAVSPSWGVSPMLSWTIVLALMVPVDGFVA